MVLRLNQARRQLLERSKWHASCIMSITPQLREFQALSSIKDIPILPAILNPTHDSCIHNESLELALGNLSQPLQQMLKSSFNESQLQAISVAIGSPSSGKDFELSLIQGPPGTGKTRTVVAIVSGLLASRRGTDDTKISLNRHFKQGNSSSMNARSKVSQSVAISRAWQDAALAKQLNDGVERSERPTENSVRRRVLICAKSNAALDELVLRIFSEGLYGSDGKSYKPYLVRVGNAKSVNANSLPFHIDTLVGHCLGQERMHLSDAHKDVNSDSSTILRSKLENLVDRIRSYEGRRANVSNGNSGLKNSLGDEMLKGDELNEMSDGELEVKLRKLYEQKKQFFRALSAAQVLERKSSEEIKAQKHKLRKLILKEAEIVVTTLSGCGGDLHGVCSESMSSCKFGNPSEHTLFDAVVVDEAAQALEPATLIPLQLLKSYGTKCLMVGDPKQLPATIISNVASKFLYQCSMFERLQRAGHRVTMLTRQIKSTCYEPRATNDRIKNVEVAISREHAPCSGEGRNKVKSDDCHAVKVKRKGVNARKNRDYSEEETTKNLAMNVVNRLKKAIEPDRNPRYASQERLSAEGRSIDRRTVASSHIGTSEDLITKRKQQREAVDAILNSSLISSKKSEASKKSMPLKRPLSPSSIVSGGTRTPKERKGTSVSSKGALHERSHKHNTKIGNL